MGHVSVKKNATVFSLALLIAGATIGAGVLGLPVQTGLSGFMPSSLGIVIIWIIMTFTALVLAERFMRSDAVAIDYPSIFKQDFGVVGKYLCVFGYLINYYGIMVAYLCGSAVILASLIPITLPENFFMLIFFIPTTIITLFGLAYVVKANALFMFLLGISFIGLIILTAGKMQTSNLAYTDWSFLIPATPVILTTFLFHNVIPSICRSLKNNRKKIWSAIIIGTSISCCIVLVWNFVAIGAVPMGGTGEGSLLYAYLHGEPATVPLAAGLHSEMITIAGMVFSLCAIFTSFVSVVIGLGGFIRDLMVSTFKIDNRNINIILVLAPSLIVSLFFPNLFLGALDIAGGVGGVLIFGVFPAMMLIKYSKNILSIKAIIGIILFLFLGFLILLDIAQQFHIVDIKPKIEQQSQLHTILTKAL
jgi:tyrosine-specific transport protein